MEQKGWKDAWSLGHPGAEASLSYLGLLPSCLPLLFLLFTSVFSLLIPNHSSLVIGSLILSITEIIRQNKVKIKITYFISGKNLF